MNMYDLAIIGGGPGGYVAAERAGAAGLKVVLFEKKSLGGVCLNEGCIPTKTLLYSAKVYNYAVTGDHYGVYVKDPAYKYEEFVSRKDKVVRKLVGGIKAAMKGFKVEVVNESAMIQGRSAEGITVSAAGTDYVARNLLICSGSEAVVPPFPGLKEAGDVIVTNREILALKEQPKELVVIGGGVIGMEFAAFYSTLGTKVTVVEMLPKILGPLDDEISTMLQGIYAKRGINFCLRCKVTGIEGNTVVYEDPDGKVCRVSGDKILVSVGRRANLQGFGLENLGVEMTLNKAGRPVGIKVDEKMRTNIPGVYAAGDVTGFSMLAHTASREGEVAVNNILGKQDRMRYNAIPGVVYTNPEVAGVGLTEGEAKAKGIDFTVVKLPMAYSGRFVAENEGGEGICKIIVGKKYREVLGVHMLGNPCSEILAAACIAIEGEMTLEQLKEVVFPHPTVSEIIKETAFSLK
ncbi:MAG: dihydrolipoyl dehydrogenase [Bacteroidales bacterium]|jgi:dihydrolipoamide dehydrogenase|nr:dihydrolipoyl dehydrogenase [Bacteroidales bacterium]MBO6238491.1 dihydrolipoyl dehydrogenase [Bacteroidales bacterium]MBR1487526.1 dihydrolipoyl dehydrogenase [Bacteroidales bacterium]MBR1577010.1 dihydrolipoyl dehydrogenase [Bacteroidales bacterium]MDO4999088.1 dihydrolipoyl dehydrogenase [Bacteroidales bacterium]